MGRSGVKGLALKLQAESLPNVWMQNPR